MDRSKREIRRATWLKGEPLADIPLRPRETHYPPTVVTSLTGLAGPFEYPLFHKRLLLFDLQRTHIDDGGTILAYCPFYERLRSLDELIAAMRLDTALSDRGLKAGQKPILSVITTIFPSMFDAPHGMVPLPETDERPIGDHVVMAVAFEHEHLFFEHNWGPDWGLSGRGCFSVDYLNRFLRDAWAVRLRGGPSADGTLPYQDTAADLGPSDERFDKLFLHTWDEDEWTGFRTLHRGTVLDVLGRWLVGAADGCLWFQCIAVLREAEGGPLIVGWIHIRGTLGGADVEELFVWPPYRQRGIATALVGHALLTAFCETPWQWGRWTWLEQEADAVIRRLSPTKPHVPTWLRRLLGNPNGAILDRKRLLGLLGRLATLEVPDGIRRLRIRDGAHVMDVLAHEPQDKIGKIRGYIETRPPQSTSSGLRQGKRR